MKCFICGKYIDSVEDAHADVKIIGEEMTVEDVDRGYVLCSETCLQIDKALFEAEIKGSDFTGNTVYEIEDEQDE